ncbi:MAG: hypothetical protein K6G25_06410 [Bacteroidales bacterium]|nr:hypothetical protein [Bacteroidales bacterium]
MTIIERLSRAIKGDRFNYEKYLGGGTWYGHYLQTMPLHCSYGQIGFSVTIDYNDEISYDWELKELCINP